MSEQIFSDNDELTCKPLDSLSEIQLFLENLPSWRTLSKEIQPHSEYLIKNSSLIEDNLKLSETGGPATFCHFDPDTETTENEVRIQEKKLPKTLVCHDMANGYHDDCKIDGTGCHNAYTFYNWAGIDIFCYFSHHLITIPPLGWINVGHTHGVKVIGTLITEWAEGQKLIDKVLESESEYKNFANALVTIAKTLNFDGWLLNVENKVSKPDVLLEFVDYLHKTLHSELKNPVLIWYDSVTKDGTLNWQNALNERNKPYFDACDGIFTNYSWTEEQVHQSAIVAGDRLTDVYIGIDVWGRNFYGGGQFNTHEAVSVAYSAGCSLAIFAPAWTHEAMTFDENDINTVVNADGLPKYDHFLLRDRALWDSIWPYLNTRVPSRLPFKTSFCRGQGIKRRLYGEVLCPVPWYNLRHMQYQPNSLHGRHCYIMTAVNKIKDTTHKGKKGIIKLYEDKATTSKEKIECVSETECSKDSEDENVASQQPTDEFDGNEKRRNKKRNIRDVFKQIFKVKTKNAVADTHEEHQSEEKEIPAKQIRLMYSKPSHHDGEVQAETDDGEKKDEHDNQSDGKSMCWTSLNINLGMPKQLAATRYGLTYVPDERSCLEVYFNDSFTGGSSLKVNPCEKGNLYPRRIVRLFHCDFVCMETLVFCVVTKTLLDCEKQTLNIKLMIENADTKRQEVNLIGRIIPTEEQLQQTTSSIVNIYPLNGVKDFAFRNVQNYLLLNEPEFYVPVENSYNWKVRYFKLHAPGARVTAVNCCLGLESGPILLGHFGVCSMRTIAQEKAAATDG